MGAPAGGSTPVTVHLYAAVCADGAAVMTTRRGRGRWHFLDPVGARLWQHLAGGSPPGQAVEELTAYWARTGADPGQIHADLTALAEDLRSSGLLDGGPHRGGAAAPVAVHEVRRAAAPVRPRTADRVAATAGLLAAL